MCKNEVLCPDDVALPRQCPRHRPIELERIEPQSVFLESDRPELRAVVETGM